ncbi:tumor necrosis factor receptor superfamily member 6 [Xenopus laevis]|uniref:Tumor necrosis factor receptor superfamily member 6 n=2 Tax=Xenopus laevis TaxID=8355 RepID=A0A974CEW0_XENLA|nr:tumor necrosis factor receptor superfamily member 6 [Xenopus laevis]OCT71391.1 hypothetical protein XELAEV_18034371mg [Xenopus laevis]
MLLPWICLFITLAVERNSASAIHNIEDSSNTFIAKPSLSLHKVFKRQSKCLDWQYPGNQFCCGKCPAGTRVENDCQKEHENSTCIPCTEGKDYMDQLNGYNQCLRCKPCDQEQEVDSPCTVFHDTVCKCKANYFCSSNTSQDPRICDHCLPCTQCGNGIAEKCTATKDTVCKGSRSHWAALGALIPLVVCAVVCVRCRQKTRIIVPPRAPQAEPYPSYLKDIDLEPHLQDLAGKMLYEQMVQCVRKMDLTEPVIDDIKNSHGKGFEGKYQLLRSWYTYHGQTGAFQQLIETLQERGFNRPAQNIIDFLKSKVQP